MQSTLLNRSSAARDTSAVVVIPFSTSSKSYFLTRLLYSSIADTEFASLVVYMIPIFFASGSISRIILSCSSTGSLSDVPVTSPTGFPSLSASSAATGSVTAV